MAWKLIVIQKIMLNKKPSHIPEYIVQEKKNVLTENVIDNQYFIWETESKINEYEINWKIKGK